MIKFTSWIKRGEVNKMKKEYNLKIEDKEQEWTITFETKPKNVYLKKAIIKTLWNSEPLTILRLMEVLTSYKGTRNTSNVIGKSVTRNRLSNILRGEHWISVADMVTTASNYVSGSYETNRYKLNKDFLKGCELVEWRYLKILTN